MSRPIEALIDLAALRHNLERVRRCAPGASVWAVVKADAYGHGLCGALPAFESADGLALVEFEQALRLRQAGWNGPILMLEGAFAPADLATALELRLCLALHNDAQLRWVETYEGEGSFDLHLKFNSGMNRLGFDRLGFRDAFRRLLACGQVRRLSLMTHFANSDLPGGADEALFRFDQACHGLEGRRSTSNSAAILAVPQAHRDEVRPGIMLYGASPFADRSAAELGLRPAMVLRSELIGVRSLEPGDAVGYGSTFVARTQMRVGVVACGYADGYPRHAPTGTPVAVAGVRTRTLGRVSMDMLAVDLEALPDVGIGAPVELWGAMVPIDEVAASAGTIGYELMCAVAPRVPRKVIG